jgi:hypothetical protein
MSRIPDQLAQLSARLTRAEALLARQRERVHQRQPLRRTEPAAFLCPHCALTLQLKDDDDGTLIYDIPSWHRRCQHKTLESPALCQLISRDAVVH